MCGPRSEIHCTTSLTSSAADQPTTRSVRKALPDRRDRRGISAAEFDGGSTEVGLNDELVADITVTQGSWVILATVLAAAYESSSTDSVAVSCELRVGDDVIGRNLESDYDSPYGNAFGFPVNGGVFVPADVNCRTVSLFCSGLFGPADVEAQLLGHAGRRIRLEVA